MELFASFLDIIGVIAFAISGAMTAMRKNMDIFGVCVLGVTTAVGGGILRDVLLGYTPPRTFEDPTHVMIALMMALLIFFPAVRSALLKNHQVYEMALRLSDAAGLGIFTVNGLSIALESGYGKNWFLVIFVAVITGVGGGVIRDIFAGDRPYIFVRHVYACASIIGAFVAFLLWSLDVRIAMVTGVTLVIAIRLLAVHYRWSLPKAMDNLD